MTNEFMSNMALDFACGSFLFLPANAIYKKLSDTANTIAKKCHIYMIVEVPKAHIDPTSLKFEKIDGNKITYSFDLVYFIGSEEKKVSIESKNEHEYIHLIDNEVGIRVSDCPHRNLEAFDSLGVKTTIYDINAFIHSFQVTELTTAKVLYVGQAYGSNGNRSALDRLVSHKTLQKILADYQEDELNKSILVGMFEFSPARMMESFNGALNIDYRQEEEEKRIQKAIDGEILIKEQIAIIEASIIRYFVPKYNILLKNNLPSKESMILAKCYEYDFSALSVTIWTKIESVPAIDFNLYSDNVSKNSCHLIKIDLHNPEDRKQFFMLGESLFETDLIRHNRK